MRSPVLWMESLKPAATQASSSDPSVTEQKELPPRKMHESYAQVKLPLGSQPDLLEKYVNASGGIRTGELP